MADYDRKRHNQVCSNSQARQNSKTIYNLKRNTKYQLLNLLNKDNHCVKVCGCLYFGKHKCFIYSWPQNLQHTV